MELATRTGQKVFKNQQHPTHPTNKANYDIQKSPKISETTCYHSDISEKSPITLGVNNWIEVK